MDAARFQKLLPLLTELGTRRELMHGGLVALGLGALELASLPDETTARKRSRRRNRSRRQRNRNRGNNSGNGGPGNGSTNNGSSGGDDTNLNGDFRASTCTRICAVGCDFTSVQAAIDATPDGGTLVVCGGQFKEDITITKNLTLAAVTGGELTLEGTGTTSVVSLQNPGVTVTLQRVSIGGGIGTHLNGELWGGGILNFSTLTLTDCWVGFNTADHGGGIYNIAEAPLTLVNTELEENTARQRGGALYNDGTVTIGAKCDIDNNRADRGGGIFNTGLQVTLSEGALVNGNTATSDGGGIFNQAQRITIDASFIQDNTAGRNGGGILNHGDGIVTMQNGAVIDDNKAQSGGGFYNLGIIGIVQPTLTMTDSAISRNTAEVAGGGIFNDDGAVSLHSATVFANSSRGPGGGIFNTDGGSLTLDAESAVAANMPNNCIGTSACPA